MSLSDLKSKNFIKILIKIKTLLHGTDENECAYNLSIKEKGKQKKNASMPLNSPK